MGERLNEFPEGTVIVLVTFTDADSLAAYVARQGLPFPVLRDPERLAYRAYGFSRGSIARVWGWRTLRRYLEIVRARGWSVLRRAAGPTEDTLQLAGDVVVAPDGRLSWAYWGDGPADRPTVDALVNACHESLTPK